MMSRGFRSSSSSVRTAFPARRHSSRFSLPPAGGAQASSERRGAGICAGGEQPHDLDLPSSVSGFAQASAERRGADIRTRRRDVAGADPGAPVPQRGLIVRGNRG